MSDGLKFFEFDTHAIKQQQLKAVQPILTPVFIVVSLVLTGIVFIVIGSVVLDASKQVVEYTKRYDNIDACRVLSTDAGSVFPMECNVTIKIDRTMKPPIYFYVELHNYYQNHRRYLQSKSDLQLQGEELSSVSSCSPYKKFNGMKLYPCGLVAQTFFSDRFSLTVGNKSLCPHNCVKNKGNWSETWEKWYEDPDWSMDGIAWDSDKNDKFKYTVTDKTQYTNQEVNQNNTGLHLPSVNNSDLIVWMRNAALPTFRKLHRVIKEKELRAGENVTVTILNFFAVDETESEKHIVLTTTKWIGGHNFFLAWAFIAVGCAFIILAIIFTIVLLIGKRALKTSIQTKITEVS